MVAWATFWAAQLSYTMSTVLLTCIFTKMTPLTSVQDLQTPSSHSSFPIPNNMSEINCSLYTLHQIMCLWCTCINIDWCIISKAMVVSNTIAYMCHCFVAMFWFVTFMPISIITPLPSSDRSDTLTDIVTC